MLEAEFSPKEIKMVVWDCGRDGAPGPNGFSFRFLKHYRDILGSYVIDFVQDFL